MPPPSCNRILSFRNLLTFIYLHKCIKGNLTAQGRLFSRVVRRSSPAACLTFEKQILVNLCLKFKSKLCSHRRPRVSDFTLIQSCSRFPLGVEDFHSYPRATGQRPKQSHSVKHSSNPPGGTHFLQRLKVKGVTEGSVGRYDWDPVNHLTPDYYLRLGERFYSQLHTHVYKSPPELTPPTFSVLRQMVKYPSQSWSHFDPETLQPCTWSSVLVFISRRLYWFISEFLQPIRFELSTNLYPQKDQITSYNSHTPGPAFGFWSHLIFLR